MMIRREQAVVVSAEPRVVFELIHNYERRLEWDSMLSEAVLLDGATAAGLGVSSRCVARWRLLRAAVESEYVSFEPGRVAAVKMTRGPWCFEAFAATIRHEPLDGGRSRVTYICSLSARPRWLRVILEPFLGWLLSCEVRWRLKALQRFIGSSDDVTQATTRN